jgi:hypothetical protein
VKILTKSEEQERMFPVRPREISIRVKEEINKDTIQDIFESILSSRTIEEFVERDFILSDICDRLYQEEDSKSNMDIDFYGILNKVKGIYDDQITHFVDCLQDHEFNLYFQHYLQYRIYRLDKLFQEDTRRTKLSEYSKERLELFFQDSTYNDQEKVIRILYKQNRKDLLFLISKGFGVSLRQFQFESPLSFDSEEDEVHIEIPEDVEDDLSYLL